MPKVYGHRACKSLVEVAEKNHTHTAAQVGAAAKDHTHTPEEVGALPASTVIPDKVSMLENDSGFGFAENFSEVEQLTGGMWFDGKPIYRISKYFPSVAFGGVGQWTTVGDLPIDMASPQYNVIDVDVRLLMGINNTHKACAGVRLPIYDGGGALSSPWMMSETQLAFNWRGGATKPFDSCGVLVTVCYTKTAEE